MSLDAIWLVPVIVALCGSIGQAQALKIEALKEAAPGEIAPAVRQTLAEEGVRVVGADGKPWLDFWVRKEVPGMTKPGAPRGAILYPFLKPGELVAAARFHGAGHDYRDQEILEGSYTVRYGLQPVNGDHLGVSTHRDYFLLLPAEDDQEVVVLGEDDLNLESSNAAGTNHPAVFLLAPVPEPVDRLPAVVVDDANQRTGLALVLPVLAEGEEAPVAARVLCIVIGVGPH